MVWLVAGILSLAGPDWMLYSLVTSVAQDLTGVLTLIMLQAKCKPAKHSVYSKDSKQIHFENNYWYTTIRQIHIYLNNPYHSR